MDNYRVEISGEVSASSPHAACRRLLFELQESGITIKVTNLDNGDVHDIPVEEGQVVKVVSNSCR